MPFNVSNQAERNLLVPLIAAIEAGGVHLFTPDIILDEDTVVGDLTVPTLGDYAIESPGTWGAATTDVAGVGFTDSPVIEFSTTDVPGQDCFGWYVVGAGGEYLFGSRFSDAPRLLSLATPIQFSMRFQLRERV